MKAKKGVPKENGKNSSKLVTRRDLLKEYGPYTAPLVVSMLVPKEAYGHNNMIPYSTSAACASDASGGFMHSPTRVQHCMINGAAGGMNTHPVANPGPP